MLIVPPTGGRPGKYVVFGRVISGLRVVHKIGRVALENERPLEPVRITEVPLPAVGSGRPRNDAFAWSFPSS